MELKSFFLGIGVCLAAFVIVYSLRKLSLKGILVAVAFAAAIGGIILFLMSTGMDTTNVPCHVHLGPFNIHLCAVIPLILICVFFEQIIYILVWCGLAWLAWNWVGPFIWDLCAAFPILSGLCGLFLCCVLALAAMNHINKFYRA